MCLSKCIYVLVCMNEHVFREIFHFGEVFMFIRDRLQISLIIQSEFKQISIPLEIIGQT